MKKITLMVSEKVEATSSPWWSIIDPRQNFRTDNQALHDISSMITGPFFSRKEAEDYLKATRYNFGKNAKVFCHSGHHSKRYHDAYTKPKLRTLYCYCEFCHCQIKRVDGDLFPDYPQCPLGALPNWDEKPQEE